MAFHQFNGMEPAGSINSSVTDMLRWVQLFLNKGQVDDRQLLSAMAINEMTRPQIALPVSGYPEIRFSNYGMGWMIDDYRGDVMVHHGGNIDGFSTLVAMMPHRQLGVVVLTNMNGSPVPFILTYQIFDEILDHSVVDWNARIKPGFSMLPEDSLRPPRQIEGTSPSRSLDLYTGFYEHPAYGRIVITLDEQGESLWFKYNNQLSSLEHWHYDVFAGRLSDVAIGVHLPIHFRSDADGQIRSLEIPFEPTLEPIRFTVTADPTILDPQLLAGFSGVYEVMGIHLNVRMRDNELLMEIPGQGTTVLTLERGMRFAIKDMAGFSVEFIEENGKIVGLYLNQPNGTFEATLVE